MTAEQLDSLMAWVDARIEMKIEDAFHRDSLNETLREIHAQKALHAAFNTQPTQESE